MFTIETGVNGAVRTSTRTVETFAEAQARADRWAASNSQGSYWARVTDSTGREVYRPAAPRRDGYCKHGTYVGGIGVDWMCGPCENGE
jgi:hypothetical protein